MRSLGVHHRQVIRSLTQLSEGAKQRAAQQEWTSANIRKTFLEYFRSRLHLPLPSSSVVPHCDPSLAFVNAGMVQFKPCLLGQVPPPSPRVATVQKCVRVGGRHDDLEAVGDSSHHTFFEMLGNWSFGDYFKREAMALSWEMLTQVYCLPPERLYVTVFGGDVAGGLQPDLESAQIWKDLGVPESHIVLGMADNFWEMGLTGPCGPCTEVHYDHLDRGSVPHLVNQHNSGITELWNIVFVQYNREVNGELKPLVKHSVDTGMGLERLTAILQQKTCNYDTDLFTPLFVAAERGSGRRGYGQDGRLDAGYRLLADHSRMITVALSDGLLPDQEGKVRSVMRRAFNASEKLFGVEQGLVKELTNHVAEILAPVYPEIGHNLHKVHYIINHEEALYKSLRKAAGRDWKKWTSAEPPLEALDATACPGLPEAVRLLQGEGLWQAGAVLGSDVAHRVVDGCGVGVEVLQELSRIKELKFDRKSYEAYVEDLKHKQKEAFTEQTRKTSEDLQRGIAQLVEMKVPTTSLEGKYRYRGEGEGVRFEGLEGRLRGVWLAGEMRERVELCEVNEGAELALVLDRSNLYHESGGQESDSATLYIEYQPEFRVTRLVLDNGYLFHFGTFTGPLLRDLRSWDRTVVRLDEERRLGNMRNHTATHILNAFLHHLLTVTVQKSSKVTRDSLTFDFAVYDKNLTLEDLSWLEQRVRGIISSDVAVVRRLLDSSSLNRLHNVTVLPGAVYPLSGISLLEINCGYFLSREPCCGTHVPHTGLVEDFIITQYRSLSSGVKRIKAVTGQEAARVRRRWQGVETQWVALEGRVQPVLQDETDFKKFEELDSELGKYKTMLAESNDLPFVLKEGVVKEVEFSRGRVKFTARALLRHQMEEGMRQSLEANTEPFVVTLVHSPTDMDLMPLEKVTRMTALPSLIIDASESLVRARCVVPKSLVSSQVTASAWLGAVSQAMGGQARSPRGQNADEVSILKTEKMSSERVERGLEAARLYAVEHFKGESQAS